MLNLQTVAEGSVVKYDGKSFEVKGKVLYITEKEPKAIYAKMVLNDHNVLVVSPEDNIAYIGKNHGHLSEFDGFPQNVIYKGKEYEMINHDYQIVDRIVFGNPIEVEGEVEFWDYENEDTIISVAVSSRKKIRADVVAKYINVEELIIE